MDFCDWLAAKVGTRKWCVFPRLTDRVKRKGYELAIPQKKFSAYLREYEEESSCSGLSKSPTTSGP